MNLKKKQGATVGPNGTSTRGVPQSPSGEVVMNDEKFHVWQKRLQNRAY